MSDGGHGHKHPDNPFAALLVVVSESILEVFLISLTGYILARKGIVTSTVRRSLNKLNVSLFTPALLFSKVAFSLTPAKLAELWIVPLGFVVVTGVSMAVAWLVSKLLRLKRSQGAFAIACSAFPNSNSLPVALMQSLVFSVKDLKWGKDDTKDEMLGRALSYLVLFSTLGIVARWSFGVKLLSIADDPEPAKILNGHEPQMSPTALEAGKPLFIPSDGSSESLTQQTNPGAEQAEQHAKSISTPRPKRGRKTGPDGDYFASFPNTPVMTVDSDLDDDDDPSRPASVRRRRRASDDEDDFEDGWGVGGYREGTRPARSRLQQRWRKTRRSCNVNVWQPVKKVLNVIKNFMTVPLYAALASLVVCCIPPFQHFLGTLVPVKEALRQAGNCSIPLTLVVLGGFMHEEKDEKQIEKARQEAKKRKESMTRRRPLFNKRTSLRRSDKPAVSGETRTVIAAILSRMVITPAILLPLLWLYSLKPSSVADGMFYPRLSFTAYAQIDPVFIVAACLAIGSPPALTLAQITDAASGDAFERLISKTMLWAYALVTPPTTIILVLLGLKIDQADNNAHRI